MKLHFGVFELTYYVATARRLGGDLLLSSSLHARECLSRQLCTSTLYITQRRKVTGLTRLRFMCHLTLKIFTYVETDLHLIFRSYRYDFKLYKVSHAECIWTFVLPSVTSTSSRAPSLVKVIWYFVCCLHSKL